MALRLLIVAALLGLVAVGCTMHRRRTARLARPRHHEPPVDPDLVADAARTWLVFTTPYCATCGPVIDRLGTFDPEAAVVVVDVADRPDLAHAHHIRTAPTTLLATRDGTVLARLTGAVDEVALETALSRV